ncbi:uncharacterized protein TrAtP1_002932 [Trichoderma atroviride]|uniref:uncharacterized protein n=1 Tax=Hypocrea atroviridis TaxID=63577 RepID=UPI00331A5C44|nr:hypothetical protein TrAtP1_002932 [Trichoderma atroviride]
MEYRHSDKMPISSAGFFKDNKPRPDSEKITAKSESPHMATPGCQGCTHRNSSDQASCPNCNAFAFLDQLMPNTGGIGIDDNLNALNNYTSTEDIKWMLMGITSRLDALETAVSTGNSRIIQLNTHMIASLGNIPSREEFMDVMNDLKKSVKGFTKALLLQLFGCHVLGEVDAGHNS